MSGSHNNQAELFCRNLISEGDWNRIPEDENGTALFSLEDNLSDLTPENELAARVGKELNRLMRNQFSLSTVKCEKIYWLRSSSGKEIVDQAPDAFIASSFIKRKTSY